MYNMKVLMWRKYDGCLLAMLLLLKHSLSDTVCPTRYRTRHFFNNSNTN